MAIPEGGETIALVVRLDHARCFALASEVHPETSRIALRLGPCSEGALREHLAASGVAIVEEREENCLSGRSLSLYVRDPSENQIELILTTEEL